MEKILVVGSGGREHALTWIVSKSPLVSKIYCAPGSAGIAKIAECVAIKAENDEGVQALADFAEENGIGLTIVGPEAPLVAGPGVVDEFTSRGLKIVGPTMAAAQLEASKVFAKEFMRRHNIPTADFECFDDPRRARTYAMANLPCAIKADGLAAGKGVILCHTEDDVKTAVRKIMIDKELGEAGKRVVVEKLLRGEEATVMVLTDGWDIIPLLATQDHKPVFNNDEGPNTGGMGAYAPAPVITPEMWKRIVEEIIKPTLEGMRKEGRLYKGVLYVGLMITPDGPKVLEFNVRFGDPELQPLALLMESDIVPILQGIADGRLPEEEIQWSEGAAVCIVMASQGYPGTPETNKEIKGLEEVAKMENVKVFHAGTKEENGVWKTVGGRVLGVTAKSVGISGAIGLACKAVAKISWEGEHHRTDIGRKALERGFQLKMKQGGDD